MMKYTTYILLAIVGLTAIIFTTSLWSLVFPKSKREVPKRRSPIELVELVTARSGSSNQQVELVQPTTIETTTPLMSKIDLVDNVTIEVPMTFAQELAKIPSVQVPTFFKGQLANAISSQQIVQMFAMALTKVEKIDVQAIFAMALEKVDKADVPTLLAMAIENVDNMEVQKILAMALAHVDEMNCNKFVAETYIGLVKITTPTISAQELIDIRKEWYDKFHAHSGSKMWWILRIAKQKAENGEDLTEIKKSFEEAFKQWLAEEDN